MSPGKDWSSSLNQPDGDGSQGTESDNSGEEGRSMSVNISFNAE